MKVKTSQKINVPLTRLVIREGFNARSDDADPAEVAVLAASIATGGLIHDVCVVEDPKRESYYLVVSGFTRARAIMHLAMTTPYPADQEVTVTLVTADNPTALFLRNLTENVVRRDLRMADVAKRCCEMVDGDCKGFDGEKLPPVSVQLLARELQKSPSFVRELVRAWRGACPAVRQAWQKDEIVTDQVRRWCKLEAPQQKKELQMFREGPTEEELAAIQSEKSRSVITVGAAEAGEEMHSSKSASNGKNGHSEKEHKGPTRSELQAKAEAFAEKIDSGEFKGEDLKLARAKWEALRWAAGDLRRLGYT